MKVIDLWTYPEAAAALKMSRQRVHQLVKAGRLTQLKAFGRQVVSRAEVKDLGKELRASRVKFGPKRRAARKNGVE